MNTYLEVIARSVIVYVFIILALRLFGKKELSQISIIDLVFILLISNSVQNAMIGDNSSLTGGLTAAASLFLTNFLLKNVVYRSKSFSKMIQGVPVLLIHQGAVLKNNLEHEKISMEELETAIREHGVSNIDQVDMAVLELDGSISILTDNYSRKSVRKRRAHKSITK